MMIKSLAVACLVAGGVAAGAAGLGARLDLDGPAGPMNGWLLLTLASLPIGLVGAGRCLKGRDRLVSMATLTLATVLCVVALLWRPSEAATLDMMSAGSSRFWTLFDLVLYTVAALVLMNAGLIGGRGRRDDD